MNRLEAAYQKHKESFLVIDNLKLKIWKKKLTQEEEDKEWEEVLMLENKYYKNSDLSVFIENSTQTQKEAYNHWFVNLFAKSVEENEWLDVFLSVNLIDDTLLTGDLTISICQGINIILEKGDLTIYLEEGSFELSKGALLESIVLWRLNIKIEQEVIRQTMVNILSKMDKEDLENYHLINISKSTLKYVEKN